MKISKDIKTIIFYGVVLIGILAIVKLLELTPTEENYAINQFEKFCSNRVTKIIVYCMNNRPNADYKIIITNQDEIKKLINSSQVLIGKKKFEGRYEQHYLIMMFNDRSESYSFQYEKMYTVKNAKCKDRVEYKGNIITNKYNDCGQLSLLNHPEINEAEHVYNPLPYAKISFVNLELIPFLEEHADSVSFDDTRKTKFKYRSE